MLDYVVESAFKNLRRVHWPSIPSFLLENLTESRGDSTDIQVLNGRADPLFLSLPSLRAAYVQLLNEPGTMPAELLDVLLQV